MKTAQEILFEGKVARESAEKEKRKWAELKRQCQSPAVLVFTWFGILLVLSLIGAQWLRSHPGDWKGLPFAPFATLLFMAPGIFAGYQRRQKALMRIIEIEAPQLFQKLKHEGIA